MNRHSSLPCLRPHTLLAARTDDRRGPGPRLLALAAAAAVFLLAGATFAAGAAQASFAGTNGPIACAGPLGPNPTPSGQSILEVFSMNSAGGSQTRLTTNTVSEVDPTYSADGTKIVFISDNNVWRMNADGTAPVELTTGNNTDRVGGWSPDGTKIVFQRSVEHSPGAFNFEIFTMNADGSNQVNITNNPGSATVGSNDSQPSWSPDGSKIAFHSSRLGNSNIHVMNADGSGVRVLTADSYAEESAPEFSPDGQQIAFQSDRGFFPRPGVGRNLEIYRMNAADGSGVTQLTFSDYNLTATGTNTTSNLTGFDLEPYWSPAGDKIVFHSGRNDAFMAAQWDVYTIGAVNGEHGVLGAPAVQLTNRDGNDFRCSWGTASATQFQHLSVTKAGSGEGTVTTAAPGIDCGLDCGQGYAAGTVVTLTAAPAANGSTFTSFTGCDSTPTATTCTVTMNSAKAVTANFSDPSPTLTVTKLGSGGTGKASTGDGTVTSVPAGIDCAVGCTEDAAEFSSGAPVTLTAAAAPGSTFDGFRGGGCSGATTTCVVTVDAAKTVKAVFSGPPLTVTKAGTGAASIAASVTSNPLGVFCGVDCSEDFATGASVVLTASAIANNVAGGFGVAFTGFTGDCDSTTATTCTVAMGAAKNVTATFTDFPTLTVTKTGAGTGTVASGAGGLNCGATCMRDFAPGSTVTLTATPAAGSGFAGFAGCATTPTATTCTVTADAAKTVTATFTPLRSLTVTKAGDGAGTVTSAPSGISCGADCEQAFVDGSGVALTAEPAAGSSFTGFTGAGCSGSGTTCAITMNEAKSVTATFAGNPVTPPPALTPPPPPPPAVPGATPARRSGSLSASVTPSRDLRAPFSFRTTGRLTRPSGITQAAGCNGRVSVQIKRGNTTISTRRVTLSSTCTFSSRVSFSNRRRFGSATRLRFSARFLGNARILPDSAPTRFARIRR